MKKILENVKTTMSTKFHRENEHMSVIQAQREKKEMKRKRKRQGRRGGGRRE